MENREFDVIKTDVYNLVLSVKNFYSKV